MKRVFTVEKVLAICERKGRFYYLVKWQGYNNRYNRWILEQDLICDPLVILSEVATHGIRNVDRVFQDFRFKHQSSRVVAT